MIRVLLVDDHVSSRSPLAFLLNHEPGLVVVGEAGSIADALTKLDNVDVAVIDLDLPDGRGGSLIPKLRERSPGSSAIILTGSSNLLDCARAIQQGATAALHKSSSTDMVIQAVRRAYAGEPIHTREECAEFVRVTQLHEHRSKERHRLRAELTQRERELLVALAEGLSDREMADRLSISPRTVQSHMTRLFEKLETESRLQALIVAVRHGLVEISAS